MEIDRVRGIAVPPLLLTLIAEGRWRHPGAAALASLMRWFEDPLYFPGDVAGIGRESKALDAFTVSEATARFFRIASGPTDLPWLDVDQSMFIAVNERLGDDVAIALDFRTDAVDPRVVASDFWTEPGPCSWRQVTPTFSDFGAAVGL